MESALIAFIIEMAGKYPQLTILFVVMGVFRSVFKPLCSFLRVVADATPTKADNELLDKFQDSKVYKALAWFADYLLSVKLPGVK